MITQIFVANLIMRMEMAVAIDEVRRAMSPAMDLERSMGELINFQDVLASIERQRAQLRDLGEASLAACGAQEAVKAACAEMQRASESIGETLAEGLSAIRLLTVETKR